MSVSEYFAGQYADAQSKFLDAARVAGMNVTHYSLPGLRSPDGEELVTDVALLGAEKPESLLILISGTHGVEGFCGSGCQIGYLTDRLYEALPPTSAVILIHALNPFGFAWLRRVNEDNVDLNRNFQDFAHPLPSAEAYEALHDSLLPEDWNGPQRAKADAALLDHIRKNGFKAVQSAITRGQYSRPDGLFYGGKSETWSNRTLRQIIERYVGPTVRRLAVLDVHTGLGPTGFGEPIYVGPSQQGFELAKKWYGDEVKSTLQDTSVSSYVTGSIADALPPLSSQFEVTYLALEFGTVPALDVLTALRADNWLHAVPSRITDLRDGIKRQLREAFYCDASWWKAAVYGRSCDFFLRATRALS